ncbi:MAG: alpha-galactosidase [Lachnospiraceae bacterium]|nr:alpha-galactosidase [Lachnospiraceae bacterium]
MEEFYRKIYSSFVFNDMLVNYMLDNGNHMTIQMVPLGMEDRITEDDKILRGDNLIQVHFKGDDQPGAYAGGTTMRNSKSSGNTVFERQETIRRDDNGREEVSVLTYLKDERKHSFIHKIRYTEGDYAIKISTSIINGSDEPAEIQFLSSFSLGDITPFEKGDAPECMSIYRLRSKWSNEGRLICETIEDLQLEPSWAYWHPCNLKYGQKGSMPVKEYFPFGAAYDKKNNVTWAAMLGVETSWEMEFYRRDSALCFGGGLADREFGHWSKIIKPQETFETPYALLTVCNDNADTACQRLTAYGKRYLEQGPECEKNLPVMFNEYCTTWGLPSHENITGILDAIKGHGLSYFVVDCGWFVEEGRHWGDGMGDYIPSDKLFPEGIKHTADTIRAAGLKPGIWFEIDNVGHDAHIYENEELLLKRDGVVLTTDGRRFFDMQNPGTREYLDKKVIGQLREYGFEYMKMDYNDTIGIGCDGAESLGEGLRLDREASVDYVRHIKEELPDLILENCASGGHKLEPLMMSLCQMASFSDAHECENIPVIALSLHRAILPSQSQIWAVIRKEDNLKRIAYTMANTFLGRMCLSGDVTELNEKQWDRIDDGISFYKQIAPVIRDGFTYFYSGKSLSDRYLKGYQAMVRVKTDKDKLRPAKGTVADEAYACIHFFNECERTIRIKLPADCPRNIKRIYKGTDIDVRIEGDVLIAEHGDSMEAVAVHLI